LGDRNYNWPVEQISEVVVLVVVVWCGVGRGGCVVVVWFDVVWCDSGSSGGGMVWW